MNSVFIKSGNQIFNREHVTGLHYIEIPKDEARFFGFKGERERYSILHVYTVDGRDLQFSNDAADILWEALSDSSLDLTPNSAVDNS